MNPHAHKEFRREPWQRWRRCRTCGHVTHNLREQLGHAYGAAGEDET